MEPVKITELFTEKSIVNALIEDNWVRYHFEEMKIDISELNSLEKFFKVFGDYHFNTSSFAILNYNNINGLAAIRIIGYESIGFDHVQYLQLGLLVRPNAKNKQLFEFNTNFYLNRFYNKVYHCHGI